MNNTQTIYDDLRKRLIGILRESKTTVCFSPDTDALFSISSFIDDISPDQTAAIGRSFHYRAENDCIKLIPKLVSYYPPASIDRICQTQASDTEAGLWCAHYLKLLSVEQDELPPDDGFPLDIFRAMGIIRLHGSFDNMRRFIDDRFAAFQRLRQPVRGRNTYYLFSELTKLITPEA